MLAGSKAVSAVAARASRTEPSVVAIQPGDWVAHPVSVCLRYAAQRWGTGADRYPSGSRGGRGYSAIAYVMLSLNWGYGLVSAGWKSRSSESQI